LGWWGVKVKLIRLIVYVQYCMQVSLSSQPCTNRIALWQNVDNCATYAEILF
jgi:hypothetical protein